MQKKMIDYYTPRNTIRIVGGKLKFIFLKNLLFLRITMPPFFPDYLKKI